MFFSFITIHASDRRADGRTYAVYSTEHGKKQQSRGQSDSKAGATQLSELTNYWM